MSSKQLWNGLKSLCCTLLFLTPFTISWKALLHLLSPSTSLYTPKSIAEEASPPLPCHAISSRQARGCCLASSDQLGRFWWVTPAWREGGTWPILLLDLKVCTFRLTNSGPVCVRACTVHGTACRVLCVLWKSLILYWGLGWAAALEGRSHHNRKPLWLFGT